MYLTQEIMQNLGVKDKHTRVYLPLLNQMFAKYQFTLKEAQYFMAQILHESGKLNWTAELLHEDKSKHNYSGGWEYHGRGLIQVTHDYNYFSLHAWLVYEGYIPANSSVGVDFRESIRTPYYGTLAAFWFWEVHGLYRYVQDENFLGLTRKINGGENGWDDRKANLKLTERFMRKRVPDYQVVVIHEPNSTQVIRRGDIFVTSRSKKLDVRVED